MRTAMFLCFLTLCAAVGCEPKGPVKVAFRGKVMYKGQQLTSGILTFYGPSNEMAMASIWDDGHFEVTDVIVGTNKVTIASAPVNGTGGSSGGPGADAKPAKPPVTLPATLADVATSGTTITVTEATKATDVTIEFK